jgi:hypothetical protein
MPQQDNYVAKLRVQLSLGSVEDGAALDRGPHPSLAAEDGNARGGLRQPDGTGRYGVRPPSSSVPLRSQRSQAWNRSTSRLTRPALVFLGTRTARLVADGQVVARSAPVGS